jgi:hypothetical protein
LLNGDGDLNIMIRNLQNNTGFGRTFWKFGEELRVMALLILAIVEQSMMIIRRACSPRNSNIPNLATAISSF